MPELNPETKMDITFTFSNGQTFTVKSIEVPSKNKVEYTNSKGEKIEYSLIMSSKETICVNK